MKRGGKIRVFLGGYVNITNAQNLNCRALAKHLDKEKFEVSAMLFPVGNLEVGEELAHVKLIRLRRPVRIFKYLTYLRGIASCDVAYLPKGEICGFCYKLARLLGKKTFITVEGVIDRESYDSAIKAFKTDDGIRFAYNFPNRTYAITRFMADKNRRLLGIRSDGLLYLGVENSDFSNGSNSREPNGRLQIVFIGNDVRRKRVNEFLDIARLFPGMDFNILGGGGEELQETIARIGLKNTYYHGRLAHKEMGELLRQMDLHVFPSRSEGFPKVTLETAAAGVPSIVYSDYGAAEWITTGKDGYVVDTFDEIVAIVKDLQEHPEKLASLSRNAVEMARRFDWGILVKDWEKAIEDLYNQ